MTASARDSTPWSTMQSMAAFERTETTIGPLAFDGRTITLVARTTAIQVGGDERAVLHVRSRPTQVEVLDAHGQRHVVQIRNIEQTLIAAVTIGAIVCSWALRTSRKNQIAKVRSST
jgi:hypothetical protein